ncbi:SDR family oxidoreductase [Aurantiacibacter rhizosphaerae]|uniref:Sugar nucleotide-binding protein n=1 Tax=Aurantiacibacter rhizosphaerae TaxID=2691582 RepID=A0A844XC61_9SPHN|nr:SDR family oxidoreductase [Aurantiacibacter rhizosphaerae]MWV27095.1 sugar nucleotide-binding protein [Aurantiacibacter rhizosphaerae]
MLKILVTGAAGLIGGEVCARLAARGADVTAMVRKTREVRGNDGLPVAGITIVSGDVTLPLMGLDPAALKPDLVIHCAASLEFDAPRDVLAAVNVEGTRNAVEFARASGAGFLHVSTAYVCGQREGTIAEGPVPASTRFTNNYEESKALAEEVVACSGVSFAIARPSIVLGDDATGAIREFPSLCNAFRLMARGKIGVLPVAATSTLNLVPISHVAEGIARLAEQFAAAQGGYFHLVTQHPLPAAELARGVARVEHLPSPVTVDPNQFDIDSLQGAERMLLSRMLGTYGAYFRQEPRFEDDAFRALTGLECPETDIAWLARLIDYGVASGFLPAPCISERRDSAAQAAA